MDLPLSCGTLIVNTERKLLLCHVTNTARWDIPKGMTDPGETPLQAARRELYEEAGLRLDSRRFRDLGQFDYRRDKRLHLFQVDAEDGLCQIEEMHCSSFFPDPVTGKPTPECDGYRWAARSDIAELCWPRMGKQLLSLRW